MQKDKQMYDRAYKYLARKRKQTLHAMEHAATKPNNKKEFLFELPLQRKRL